MENGSTRNTIGTPHKNSNMTSEESEDLENRLTQLKNQVDEMSGSMLKQVDLTHSQEYLKREMENQMKKKMDEMDKKWMKWKKMDENKNDMKKKMDENKEEMQKSMNEMQKSIETILLQKIPNRIWISKEIMK
jgi:hypothetical protein